MKIAYKIDNNVVQRDVFNSLVSDMVLFHVWEDIIERNKAEIEKQQVAINFKMVNGRLKVLTDTQMLFKLNYQVRKELFNVLRLQSVLIYN
ncbi:MAG: hypothetical protein P4L41_02470 [Flavipsychrobacter sp.]|nr:hypothetical protein [Flavipsychrobacter sp.]